MVYEATPDSNRGLRSIATNFAKMYGTMLREVPYKEKFQQAVQQVPAFAWDLLGEYVQQQSKSGQSDASHTVVP